MKHRLGIQPYKRFSKAVFNLRKELRLKRYNSEDFYDLLINYGSQRKDYNFTRVINKHESISNASNKVKAFKIFKENNLRTLRFTTSIDEAKGFRFPVFCRQNYLMGGKGIKIAFTPEELILAHFYTEYINPIAEYRVNVFKDEVILWSKKEPKINANPYIRNNKHNYKFSKRFSECPPVLKDLCVNAVRVLGLDFGGVDVLFGEDNKYYLLEVNTAIGMDGSTIKLFADKIRGEL